VGALERADDDAELDGDVTSPALDRVGRAERAVPLLDLLLGLSCERSVDQLKQTVVLPKAKADATATTASETSSRVRSSSRCATSAKGSSYPTGRRRERVRIGTVAANDR
jgi:hypothetical protein